MKKMTIALLSIFVLANIAFAQQTTQQKIDSLKNEKAKVDRALAQANANFRNNESSQNYQAVQDAKAKQQKVASELTVALNQQKKEIDEKAKKEAQAKSDFANAAKTHLYNKYPEYLNTSLEDFLIKEFEKNPNFVLKDIHYSGREVFVNGKKVLSQPKDFDSKLKGRIDLWQRDPTVMADYRKVLKSHNHIESQLQEYVKSYFKIDYRNNIVGEGYTKNGLPLACNHKVSYVLKDSYQHSDKKLKCQTYVSYQIKGVWVCAGNGEEYRYRTTPKQTLEASGRQVLRLAFLEDIVSQNSNKIPLIDGYPVYSKDIKVEKELIKYDSVDPNDIKLARKDLEKYQYGNEGQCWKETGGARDASVTDVHRHTECNPDEIHKIIYGRYGGDGVYDLKTYNMPAEYKCEETLAQVAKYGIK